ncbi:hypothetical protein QR98_0032330 [Sarcoptes scabiei]|uniref:Uncharacterized protein n=1 Tax=Sarcoptes scabiei TaxID=52283 RepID=A0A132A1T7_SARSC|nr:hypothetical protein QR98_0032330 [Sarcoptes scabiei]
MRTSFDAAAAACSRSAITDAWCNANAMSAGTMGGPPNNFYPWMAIAVRRLIRKARKNRNKVKKLYRKIVKV